MSSSFILPPSCTNLPPLQHRDNTPDSAIWICLFYIGYTQHCKPALNMVDISNTVTVTRNCHHMGGFHENGAGTGNWVIHILPSGSQKMFTAILQFLKNIFFKYIYGINNIFYKCIVLYFSIPSSLLFRYKAKLQCGISLRNLPWTRISWNPIRPKHPLQ